MYNRTLATAGFLLLLLSSQTHAITVAAFGDSNVSHPWSWQYQIGQTLPGYQGAAYWDPASNTTQMINRVNQALGAMTPQQIAENYFVINGGAADMSRFGFNSPQLTLQNYDTMVSQLTAAGAQHIVVMNFLDLMVIPVSNAPNNPNGPAVHSWIATVNGDLSTRYAANSKVSVFDLHTVFEAIMLDPAGYGITPGVCAQGCMFVDNFHFGAGTHKVISDAFIAAELTPVPLPAAGWLLGSGLLGLAGAGRKWRWRHNAT